MDNQRLVTQISVDNTQSSAISDSQDTRKQLEMTAIELDKLMQISIQQDEQKPEDIESLRIHIKTRSNNEMALHKAIVLLYFKVKNEIENDKNTQKSFFTEQFEKLMKIDSFTILEHVDSCLNVMRLMKQELQAISKENTMSY